MAPVDWYAWLRAAAWCGTGVVVWAVMRRFEDWWDGFRDDPRLKD